MKFGNEGTHNEGKLVLYGWDNLSTNDGPGVRLALYFKGCSLFCPWCLNPFLQKIVPEIQWKKLKCDYDLKCIQECKNGAITYTDNKLIIDNEKCSFCGACWETCQQGGLKPAGDYISIDQIVSLVEYEINLQIPPRNITLGGGEPLLQGEPIIQLLEILKTRNINHILLTSCAGVMDDEIWRSAIELTDGFLLQLFTLEKKVWEEVSNVPFDIYLRNLHQLATSDKSLFIRIPIVPGYTNSPEIIHNLCCFIKKALPNTQQVEFRGYVPNTSFRNPLFSIKSKNISSEDIIKLCSIAQEIGLKESHWRGSMRTLENAPLNFLTNEDT